MTGLQHFNKNKKAITSPMFYYHSLIPWGSFRGRQEGKWGSFRAVGIISGSIWGPFQGWGSFRGWVHFEVCTIKVQLGQIQSSVFVFTLVEKNTI